MAIDDILVHLRAIGVVLCLVHLTWLGSLLTLIVLCTSCIIGPILIGEVYILRLEIDLLLVEEGDGAVGTLVAHIGLCLYLERFTAATPNSLRSTSLVLIISRQGYALIERAELLLHHDFGKLDEGRPVALFELQHEVEHLTSAFGVSSLLQSHEPNLYKSFTVILLALLVESCNVFHGR